MATCKTCGGSVTRSGNYYICDYCSNKWEIDSGDDIHAVDRANAWSSLRNGDFEKSAELFENIIVKENNNHEAYWGRALAHASIIYVTDINENKKVPTCNNITENSFTADPDVQKAISLAPDEISKNYQQQAEYIENVRIEWLEKASKEPAYDVFISYKDSDHENGIDRTQDSIDAQDLYNALVAEGYKVFFSRISLRNKISEQYEPYIYNAIKTAKVMIVFGEKPEYFSSVWIKNEWSRFKARIEKGEKHKNSLVVVYKNFNPNSLPTILKARQCLNAADITFLSDLTRHIKRVVEESAQSIHLEKIEITGGQVSKKVTSLSINSVKTREIGEYAISETSINEKQSISLIHTYLSESQWKEAISLADDVLFNNPSCAEAIWCKFLASHHAINTKDIFKKFKKFKKSDFDLIEKTLNYASKQVAEDILKTLYASADEVDEATYTKILELILPYSFKGRQTQIDAAFKSVITSTKFKPFELLLNTLDAPDVDKYIEYNLRFSHNASDTAQKIQCLNNILKVDEGNVEALRDILQINLKANKPVNNIISDFESLLKYCSDINKEVTLQIQWLCNNLKTRDHCDFAKQLLRYYTSDISSLKEDLKALIYRMLYVERFDEVEYFLNLMLSLNPDDPDTYWGICLMKTHSKNDADVANHDTLISELPEFNKHLAHVDEVRRKKCIAISKNQVKAISTRREKAYNSKNNECEIERHLLQRLCKAKELEDYKRKRITNKIALIIIALISLIISITGYTADAVALGSIFLIAYCICSFICGMMSATSGVPDGCLGGIYGLGSLLFGWFFLIVSPSSSNNDTNYHDLIKQCGFDPYHTSLNLAVELQRKKISELEAQLRQMPKS